MAGCLRPMNICRNNQPFPRRHSYPSTPTFTTNPLSPTFPNQNKSNGSSLSIPSTPSTPKSNGIISVYNKTNKRKRCRPSNIPTFKEQPQTKRQKIQTHQLLTKVKYPTIESKRGRCFGYTPSSIADLKDLTLHKVF